MSQTSSSGVHVKLLSGKLTVELHVDGITRVNVNIKSNLHSFFSSLGDSCHLHCTVELYIQLWQISNTIHIVKKHHSNERVSLVFFGRFWFFLLLLLVVGCFLPFQPYQPHFCHSKGRHQFGAVNSQAQWKLWSHSSRRCYPVVFLNPGDEINKATLKFMFPPHVWPKASKGSRRQQRVTCPSALSGAAAGRHVLAPKAQRHGHLWGNGRRAGARVRGGVKTWPKQALQEGLGQPSWAGGSTQRAQLWLWPPQRALGAVWACPTCKLCSASGWLLCCVVEESMKQQLRPAQQNVLWRDGGNGGRKWQVLGLLERGQKRWRSLV